MKRITISMVLILEGLRGLTQITIDQTDMPNPGDTLRVSISSAITGDFTKTGLDTTWDFSTLFSLNQQLDSFVTRQNTPFQFFFSNANLASPGGVPSFPGLPLSTPFTFYEKATGFYNDLGFAFLVNIAGFNLPAPMIYDHPDEYYSFPLTTGTNWSSNSSANLSFPGLASYYTTRNRTNSVDGWGTLKTSWGTFQTIRVKSHLIQKDSIYLDTLGTGIPITRDITQYKWLTKGEGIPVLQINQEGSVSTAIYRDIYRQPVQPLNVNLGPDTAVYKGSRITITANTNGGTPPYNYIWSTLALTPSVTVTIDTTTRYSVVVIDAVNNAGFGSRLVSVKSSGIEETTYNKLLKLFPNPSDGVCHMQLSQPKLPMILRVLTLQGTIRKEIVIDHSSPVSLEINLSDLPSGLYLLQLMSGQTGYRGMLILQSDIR